MMTLMVRCCNKLKKKKKERERSYSLFTHRLLIPVFISLSLAPVLFPLLLCLFFFFLLFFPPEFCFSFLSCRSRLCKVALLCFAAASTGGTGTSVPTLTSLLFFDLLVAECAMMVAANAIAAEAGGMVLRCMHATGCCSSCSSVCPSPRSQSSWLCRVFS